MSCVNCKKSLIHKLIVGRCCPFCGENPFVTQDNPTEEGHPLKCPICDGDMIHDSLNWEQWLCKPCKKWFFCRLDYAIVDMDNYYGFQHWRARLSQFICKSYATRENNDNNYTEIM